MACQEEEFLEMLNEESSIDLIALGEVAKHGVPDAVRGEVWKYLLGVARPDKCTSPLFDASQILSSGFLFKPVR